VIAQHGEGDAAVRALEWEAVKVSIANLRTFPCVPVREKAGKLRIHGAYFAVADGILHILDEATPDARRAVVDLRVTPRSGRSGVAERQQMEFSRHLVEPITRQRIS